MRHGPWTRQAGGCIPNMGVRLKGTSRCSPFLSRRSLSPSFKYLSSLIRTLLRKIQWLHVTGRLPSQSQHMPDDNHVCWLIRRLQPDSCITSPPIWSCASWADAFHTEKIEENNGECQVLSTRICDAARRNSQPQPRPRPDRHHSLLYAVYPSTLR